MSEILELIKAEFASDLPDQAELVRVVLRSLIAVLLGGLIGFERERVGKAAGLRTHMLVALGATLFVLVAQMAGMHIADQSRVIQGVATGIGFIGGGAILKLSEQREIKGVTTAASIWLTAAIGVAVGAGRVGVAVLGVLLAWIILAVLRRIEQWIEGGGSESA